MTIEDQAAEGFGQDSGYRPELKRTLGSFQVFAISFAFISVAVGVFGTYDDVLQNSARWASGSGSSQRQARC
jgi:hypothetical protein